MAHVIREAGGPFAALHRELMASSIDFSALNPDDFAPELVEQARATWLERTQTEFRSIQIMTRFLTEVVGAGDPIDVFAGAADMIRDEIRHCALCVGVCHALGETPVFPDPIVLKEAAGFENAPMPQRALVTAINMLCINESISGAFIADLRDRCEQPVIRAVLDRTLEDEDVHDDFGWVYVKQSLERFPSKTRSHWRAIVQETLAPHHQQADAILADLPADKREIACWPDHELVALGLFSPQRQALVFQEAYRRFLLPRLLDLDLS